MKTPEWDQCLESPMHGVAAQRFFARKVIALCRRHRTALDVGAHIGLWSIPLSERFKSVVAFEACEENFDLLVQNTKHIENVQCNFLAIGSELGSCKMSLPVFQNSGCWYVDKGNDVLMVPLDELELKDVDLIKLDIEGYEGFALQGAKELLRRDRPLVVFEDNGLGESYCGEDWINPKDVLTELGYSRTQRYQKNEIWI